MNTEKMILMPYCLRVYMYTCIRVDRETMNKIDESNVTNRTFRPVEVVMMLPAELPLVVLVLLTLLPLVPTLCPRAPLSFISSRSISRALKTKDNKHTILMAVDRLTSFLVCRFFFMKNVFILNAFLKVLEVIYHENSDIEGRRVLDNFWLYSAEIQITFIQ